MHLKLLFGLIAFLVALAANGANSQYAAIQEAKDSLRRALDRSRMKEYTIWKNAKSFQRPQYESQKIVFEPRGMGPLYNATHVILNSVIGEKAFPEGLIRVVDHQIVVKDDALDDWPNILQHYAAVIAIIVIGLLFAIITPIVGFCFCCCRCAGSCGARSQPFDKKHDTCRRVYLGLFLIIVATAMVFGVVVAFVTNSYMQEGIEDAPQAARYVTKDATVFLNDTTQHMNHLLIENFKELRENLINTLKESAAVVTKELADKSQLISLNRLEEVARMLPEVQTNLEDMRSTTKQLRGLALTLESDLRGVKRDLLVILKNCQSAKPCQDLSNQYINDLKTQNMDYSSLPDPTQVIDELDDFITNSDLQSEIEAGIKEFQSINETFNTAVEKNIKPIEQSLDKAGREIQQQSQSLMSTINNIRGTAKSEGDKMIKIADDYIKEYSQYRFYGGLALSVILLIVLLCVSFGLLCGICGKRPDGYGDDCCNKGAGSSFLMWGVAIMFLFTIVLAVVALAHFIIGLLVHRTVCVPLQNSQNDQIFGIIDDIVDLDQIIHSRSNLRVKTPGALKLSTIIEKCHNNESAYNVFSLDSVLSGGSIDDLLGYVDRFEISLQLKNMLNDFKLDSGVSIISQNGLDQLEKLEKSQLNDFKFYQYNHTLSTNVTSVNLNELADKLIEAAAVIERIDPQIARDLRFQSSKLKAIQKDSVDPLVEKTFNLQTVATDLEISLKFNTDSFSDAIRQMKEQIIVAQKYLQEEGPSFVKIMVEEVVTSVEEDIRNYLKYVVNETKNNVGQCGPLSVAYKSTLVAVCNNVLDPFNGFWAGLGWCILLFIPCIILSVKLSGLYQKSDPYPGPLVESEYLYDAYADRDNISLTSPPESKRRSKDNKKHDRHGQRESSSQGPSASHDHRYTDMARKQWDDYSEDAPPRYHSPPLPPSEYERPPPYYYPGPGSDRSPSVN